MLFLSHPFGPGPCIWKVCTERVCCACAIEEGFIQKRRQRSTLLFGGKNILTSLLHYGSSARKLNKLCPPKQHRRPLPSLLYLSFVLTWMLICADLEADLCWPGGWSVLTWMLICASSQAVTLVISLGLHTTVLPAHMDRCSVQKISKFGIVRAAKFSYLKKSQGP